MKKSYFWGIFSILLISCISNTDKSITSLSYADSLINAGCPDSALRVLESINSLDFTTKLSKAKYALLLTQAKDKAYITHTDDSLIRLAVEYFDTSKDMLQRAKAHYYWGRIFQERREVENAVREFLTASALMEDVDNYELDVLLKNNLGLLFWENGLQEEADSLYRQTIELTEMHHDTLRLVVAMVNCADIYMEKGEDYYAEADKIMSRALKLVEGVDDEHVKSSVLSSLSYLRDYQEKPQEAIYYAQEGLKYNLDNSVEKGYYLILGSAYAQLKNYGLAKIYLERSLNTDNYYTKASAYMRLSEVAFALGDKDNALKYETLYGVYKDSMMLMEQPVEVVSSLKNVLYSKSMNQYESFLIRYRLYLFLTGGLLLISLGFYLYIRKKRNAEIVKLKTKHQMLYLSIETLEKDLSQKEIEIDNQRKYCEQLEADTNKKIQLDNCLQELLEQYRQIQENLQKQLKERDEEIVKLRCSNLKSALRSSLVYAKLMELREYNNQNPDEMRKFPSEEWIILLREIDVVSLGFVERLRKKYENLLEDDIRFCCLVKLEFKYADIALIWGCSVVAVHKRSHSILERMGEPNAKKNRLLEILDHI